MTRENRVRTLVNHSYLLKGLVFVDLISFGSGRAVGTACHSRVVQVGVVDTVQLWAENRKIVYVCIRAVHRVGFALCIGLYVHTPHTEIIDTLFHILQRIGAAVVYPAVLPRAFSDTAVLELVARSNRTPFKRHVVAVFHHTRKTGRYREPVFYDLYVVYRPADTLLYRVRLRVQPRKPQPHIAHFAVRRLRYVQVEVRRVPRLRPGYRTYSRVHRRQYVRSALQCYFVRLRRRGLDERNIPRRQLHIGADIVETDIVFSRRQSKIAVRKLYILGVADNQFNLARQIDKQVAFAYIRVQSPAVRHIESLVAAAPQRLAYTPLVDKGVGVVHTHPGIEHPFAQLRCLCVFKTEFVR